MRVTRLACNVLAIVLATNVWLYCDTRSAITWFAMFVLGFFAAFPIDAIRRLYLLLFDKRPKPRIWATAVLADPQDGYEEQEEWRLIGTVTERR